MDAFPPFSPTWMLVFLLVSSILAGIVAAVKLLSRKEKCFLDRTRQSVKLTSKHRLSHDSFLFRFDLGNPKMTLGLPIGKHIKVFMPNIEGVEKGKWNRNEDKETGLPEVERKYTPVSASSAKGFFELAIKVYKKDDSVGYPDGGKMSQCLDQLQIGSSIEIQGPFGLLEYLGKGTFKYLQKELHFKKIGMIAGGTGITPMLQLIQAVASDDSDRTKISLLYANKSPDEILLSDDIEELTQQHSDRFKLWLTVDKAPPKWKYSTGFVDEKMIKEHLPGPSEETAILCCGPPAMVKYSCKENLMKLGYNMHNVFEF